MKAYDDHLRLTPTAPQRWAGMKLKIRFTLLAAILVLMVTSLGAVSAFVLLRNNESSRAISQLQIDQAATDIQNRIERFLEKGPLALTRMQRLVERRISQPERCRSPRNLFDR